MDIKDILSKMNYDGYSEGIDTIDYFSALKMQKAVRNYLSIYMKTI